MKGNGKQIIMLMDIPGGTQDQYDQIMNALDLWNDSNAPQGLISHIAGKTDNGWLVIDTWESQEDAQRFFDEKLGKASADAGLPHFQPQIVPLYNILKGSI